jgi:hypothetical protein
MALKTTGELLDNVTLTRAEKSALTALLRCGATHGVLSRLGLENLMGRLTECHRIMWEQDAHHKDPAPSLEDYFVSNDYGNRIT